MARGKGSPVIGDNGITATPEELNKLTRNARELFISVTENPVDLHNPEDVRRAIIEYFDRCERNSLRPGNLGLYAALGMNKSDWANAKLGKSKTKVSPESIRLIEKATYALGQYREGLALEGKLNPVTFIFMGKNYDGMEDNSRVEVTASTGPQAQLTPAEVAKQIEKDIPIDAEYQEIDAQDAQQ